MPESGTVLLKAARRAAQTLGLKDAELAKILHVSGATLSRNDAVEPSRAEGQLAALFVRAFRGLDTMVGGDAARARAWFDAENYHLGGVPRALVGDIEGLVRVVGYLDAVRGKV